MGKSPASGSMEAGTTPPEQWHAAELIALIRGLQPEALINDRSGLPADFSTPEQELGRRPEKDDGRLREACLTINDDWGYARTDSRYKPLAELIQLLATAAGSDCNVLLNVGPKPSGVIQPEFMERLHGMGAWLGKKWPGDLRHAARTGRLLHGDGVHGAGQHVVPAHLQLAGRRQSAHGSERQGRDTARVRGGGRERVPVRAHADGGITITAANKGWSAEDCVIAFETSTDQTGA